MNCRGHYASELKDGTGTHKLLLVLKVVRISLGNFLKISFDPKNLIKVFTANVCWAGGRLILRNWYVTTQTHISSTFLPSTESFYLLSAGSDEAPPLLTPLTASSSHQQPVGDPPASRQDAQPTQGVFGSLLEEARGSAGGGEWTPDCYSLDLDSTWEVVEKVTNGSIRWGVVVQG